MAIGIHGTNYSEALPISQTVSVPKERRVYLDEQKPDYVNVAHKRNTIIVIKNAHTWRGDRLRGNVDHFQAVKKAEIQNLNHPKNVNRKIRAYYKKMAKRPYWLASKPWDTMPTYW